MRDPSGDRKGRRAELIAEWFLRLKGYRILARRFRAPGGEVDLIAQRGRMIAFVEVKSRASREAAIEAVMARQRRRIQSAAAGFIAHHPQAAQMTCRFDIVVVAGAGLPHHVLNAWSASDDNGK